MYSATAAAVAKLRATVARLSGDQDGIAALLLPVYQDRLAAAQARLIAERDPAQREALRLADAAERAQTEQAAQKLSTAMEKISAPIANTMEKISAPVKAMTHTAFARVAALMERAKAKREAVRLAYTDVVSAVLTRKTINPSYPPVGGIATQVAQLLDLQVQSLIAAPRPGPVAGTAPAAA